MEEPIISMRPNSEIARKSEALLEILIVSKMMFSDTIRIKVFPSSTHPIRKRMTLTRRLNFAYKIIGINYSVSDHLEGEWIKLYLVCI